MARCQPGAKLRRSRTHQEHFRSCRSLGFLGSCVFLGILRWVLVGIRNQQVVGSSPTAGSSHLNHLPDSATQPLPPTVLKL